MSKYALCAHMHNSFAKVAHVYNLYTSTIPALLYTYSIPATLQGSSFSDILTLQGDSVFNQT